MLHLHTEFRSAANAVHLHQGESYAIRSARLSFRLCAGLLQKQSVDFVETRVMTRRTNRRTD